MTRSHEYEPADTNYHTCLRHMNMLYVPHYNIPGVYAVPGGGTISKDVLLSMGAEPEIHLIWSRSYMA